ncbi:MAG TPA: protoporphyrinogen oxidase [Candidatus Hydrogenedentes bacterium]|nr:protoporphyrinogen oxidase [Candidatus Hydrogenedentota bacterium]
MSRLDVDSVVIGGGVTGLRAGWELHKRLPADGFVILEATDRPGGTALTDRFDGWIVDHGPNGFLDREPLTLQWVDELGLGDRLAPASRAAARRFLYRDGCLRELLPPPRFLLSPVLSIRGRIRLCLEPLVPPRPDTAPPETVHAFAARRVGREAARKLVGAMVLGVYGGDAEQLEMRSCFPRLVEMEQRYGSLFRALKARRRENPGASPMGPGGWLTSFDGGVETLPETAARLLSKNLRLNEPASSISLENGIYTVRSITGLTVQARRVFLACPAWQAARLVAPLGDTAARALADIPYAPIGVLALGYSRNRVGHPLEGFGFLVPRGENLRLLGCLWTSSIFPGQAPADHVLLRVMVGGAVDPKALTLSDAELLNGALEELRPLLRLGGQPLWHRIYRYPRGIPQYTIGHAARREILVATERQFPGLFFCGNAYQGVGLNDCVVSALAAVTRALEETP